MYTNIEFDGLLQRNLRCTHNDDNNISDIPYADVSGLIFLNKYGKIVTLNSMEDSISKVFDVQWVQRFRQMYTV